MKTWEDCSHFHGHECPGLSIGYRAAIEAARILDLKREKDADEDIVCVTENDACGVDAIQVILGTSAGKGNLIYKLRGKMAFSIYDRISGKSVRLVSKSAFNRDTMTKQEIIDFIKTAPIKDVFDIKETTFVLPEKARLFNSCKCEKCGENTMEAMLRLEDGKKVCMDCYSPYTRMY